MEGSYKNCFFRAKDAAGHPIDYVEAIEGGLRLVPEHAARDALADDYGRMVTAGLLEVVRPVVRRREASMSGS